MALLFRVTSWSLPLLFRLLPSAHAERVRAGFEEMTPEDDLATFAENAEKGPLVHSMTDMVTMGLGKSCVGSKSDWSELQQGPDYRQGRGQGTCPLVRVRDELEVWDYEYKYRHGVETREIKLDFRCYGEDGEWAKEGEEGTCMIANGLECPTPSCIHGTMEVMDHGHLAQPDCTAQKRDIARYIPLIQSPPHSEPHSVEKAKNHLFGGSPVSPGYLKGGHDSGHGICGEHGVCVRRSAPEGMVEEVAWSDREELLGRIHGICERFDR